MSALVLAGTVAGAIVAVLSVLQIPSRWLAHGFNESREVLRTIKATFQDAKAVGGETAGHYLTDGARDADRRLEELVEDFRRGSGVKKAAEEVLRQYRRAFASAPPRRPMAFFGTGPVIGGRTTEDEEMKERQVQAAEDGLRAIDLTLRRMRRVQAFIIGR